MKKILSLFTIAVFALGCAGTNTSYMTASGELDYGDFTSQTLTTNAWNALGAGDYAVAIKYTEKVAEMYEEQAHEMQALLKAQPPSSAKKSPEEIHANWALNDVGTSYFIRGEALLQLERKDEALAAYRAVVDQFNLAQCWDPKGWFWSPAEVASKKITILANDF